MQRDRPAMIQFHYRQCHYLEGLILLVTSFTFYEQTRMHIHTVHAPLGNRYFGQRVGFAGIEIRD